MNEQLTQFLLRQQYQILLDRKTSLPNFADVEFRCHSQNGEDGILLYIFSVIGMTNRKSVEICAGDGMECNTANLIINHGFSGLLFDGDADNVERGRVFYATHPNTKFSPPKFVNTWITKENINEIVASQGFHNEIDLLSIDIDGNDYWIWKALTAVRPRVIVLEFNGSCGPDLAATMSYNPTYQLDLNKPPYRCGASLAAFVKLGIAKGYRLVGMQRLGFNAFFVRDDTGSRVLPTVTPTELYDARYGKDDHGNWRALAETISRGGEPWETV